MKIEKGRISVVKDALSMEMGLSKVDAAKRIVSGFATIDNVDLQGDVVEFDASVRAFERSRRNVREMHQPIAVGKVLSYEPKEYVDTDTGDVYKGVYVSVYVSTGAEDTWQKVLDGTLSAFSIKGPVRKAVSELREGSTHPVRVIKDYDLEELSLVDSGGNQWANVISIQKNADGDTEVTGLATDVETKNVFWCKKDKVSIMSEDETETCPDGHDMARIGWIESGDPDSVRKVREMIDLHKNTSKGEAIEGGVTSMGDTAEVQKSEEAAEVTEVTEAPVEETVETETPEGESPVVEEEIEVATDEVSEVPDDEDEIAKIHKVVGDLEKRIDSGLEESKADIREAIERIEKSINESREASESKFDAFEKRYEEIQKSLEDISGEFDAVSKSVEALDNSAALKKSNDLGGSEGAAGNTGGLWNNSIL